MGINFESVLILFLLGLFKKMERESYEQRQI
jgi:hypothetical protein